MGNKLFAGIWGTVLALLLAVITVANVLLMQYSTLITRSMGHETIATVNLDTSGKSDYFKSSFASDEELLAYETQLTRYPLRCRSASQRPHLPDTSSSHEAKKIRL